MRRTYITRFRALLVLVSIVAFLALSPAVNANGTLFGRVYGIDRENFPRPISLYQAKVTIYTNGVLIETVPVNGFDASFTVDLPPGLYDVTAECAGWIGQTKVVGISDHHTSELYFHLERASTSTSSTTTVPLLSVGLISPPSPLNGGTASSSSVTLKAQVNSSGAVQNATVSFYVDGSLLGSGYSDSNGYYSMSYPLTQIGHTYSWYATASKSGYGPATSSTYTFTYALQSATSTTSTSTVSSYMSTTTMTMTSMTTTLITTTTTVSAATTTITVVSTSYAPATSDTVPATSTQTAMLGSTSTTFSSISTAMETTSASSTTASYSVPLLPSCLIATAAYGSALSPQVQALRNFRDQLVLKTFAGNQFMKAFNAWYYSFSPSIASIISRSPSLAGVVRILIYPLIGILQVAAHIHTIFGSNSELGVVITGFVASSLIGLVYDTPWIAALLMAVKKKRRFEMKLHYLVPFAGAWVASLLVIGVARFFMAELLMMLATAAFVLLTLGLSATAAAMLISKVCAPLLRTQKL